MVYRTRTYIAADWDGDRDAVEQLHKWNDSKYWGLSFTDAHDLQQSRDTSLPCSIKRSLKERMDHSKLFVLIVGDHTATVAKGGCQYCWDYDSRSCSCARSHSIDYRSYIKYECDKALDAGIGRGAVQLCVRQQNEVPRRCPIRGKTCCHEAMGRRQARLGLSGC